MKKFTLLPLFIFLVTQLQAQDTVLRVFDTGRMDSLYSNTLHQQRLFQVFVPPGKADKYDVLYVLDGGNWNTGLVNNMIRFIHNEQYMPATIVVSVLNIDREKDFSPTHMERFKTSGGAAPFLQFLKTELIPYINKNYPSNGDNTLWGHSFGGLFVINALLNDPGVFKSYIAVDPSLWWDDKYIIRTAPEKLAALKGIRTSLFIGGRAGRDGEGMRIRPFDTLLQKLAPPDLTWKIVNYPDETHSSVRLPTTYDGLRFTYSWHNIQSGFHPMNGLILKDKPAPLWYFGDTVNVHYTLDGSKPTLSSPIIRPLITITDSATLSVRQFTNRERYDQIKTGTFKPIKAFKAQSRPRQVSPGGFHYAYYEGNTLKRQGRTDSLFFVENMPRRDSFSVTIDGFLESTEAGYYIFVLNAEKETKLYLNNQLLIEKEGSFIIPLEKGFYPLRLEYVHNNEDFSFKLSYITPAKLNEQNPIPIPFNLQYSK